MKWKGYSSGGRRTRLEAAAAVAVAAMAVSVAVEVAADSRRTLLSITTQPGH